MTGDPPRNLLHIDGQWIPAASGDTFDVIDPATALPFHRVARGGPADIDRAVASARAAFDSGPWRRTTGAERADVLTRIADLIAARQDRLARIEARDNGKPLPEALWDIADTAGCFRYYADLARRRDTATEEEIALPAPEVTETAVKASEGQHRGVLDAIARGQAEGATLVTGGRVPEGVARGYFVEPTIFADVPRDSWIWREEIFGPVVCVKPFTTEAEAVALANDTRFGLAAAVMSADLDRAERVARAFRAGIVWINGSRPTFTEAPWGGMKQSGIGRELGQWGLMNYVRQSRSRPATACGRRAGT
jgi:acyl-CoA reductase-like NAD-dependent aldehyde dehydrogenase